MKERISMQGKHRLVCLLHPSFLKLNLPSDCLRTMDGANEEMNAGRGFFTETNSTRMIHLLLLVSLSLPSGSTVEAQNVSAQAGGACLLNRLCILSHQVLWCFSSAATLYSHPKNIFTCIKALFLITNDLSSLPLEIFKAEIYFQTNST